MVNKFPQDEAEELLGEFKAVEHPEIHRAELLRSQEETRKTIAKWLTFLISFLFGILVIRLLFFQSELPDSHWNLVKDIISLVLPVYGVVIGFYFGTSR
jgi:hypothetical protein